MTALTIRLAPEDCQQLGVPQEMPYDVGKLRLSEVRLLPGLGYSDVPAWRERLAAGDLVALAALAWLACRRHGHTGGFDDFDLSVNEIGIEVVGGDGQGEDDTPPAGDSTTS